MAGTPSDESGIGRTLDGILGVQQRCQSGEALAEWRSSEQVENGIPSTSPPYWDTDDDDDYGPKPSELYGKYTWKIDKFAQINKRELRSNAFEVGGYKWYILIYPQGCDVCNHLSLFLCVANHDKLLPGWSHFAQFTIAVVNKDPKKTKYSDTLHRFWKKEHDWGWKKFMELSKVSDGFIDADTLIIKAQVQVIRERADRPFRCLDCQYRRELVRVYLTNVETHCISFIDDRRGKLKKLIEDEAKWPSFRAFWLGIDQNARRRMSREKTDAILKVVVKQFFIEKEVTSTLVMDSLYSGLKALEGQTKSKKGRGILPDADELLVPIICIEKDMFVLVDDVLLLLERTAMEALPQKDDKGPQNRMKDGGSGNDFNKDSIEREERRLTELGRKTIEIFVLAHVFSNIEVAYQEAVALKRQEELIREEEAGAHPKRGATEKEKKSKKKQGKQKRNNRKAKDKGREGRPDIAVSDKLLQEKAADEREDFMTEEAESVPEKPDTLEDVSDVSDSVDCCPEILQADSEDRDASPVNWDTDASEVHPPSQASSSGVSGLSSVQNEMRERNCSTVVDDSSSTCSTDSVPSVVLNGPSKGNSLTNQTPQKSPSRGRNQRSRVNVDATAWGGEVRCQPSEATTDIAKANDASGSCKAESESVAVVHSLQVRIKELEKHMVKKEEEVITLRRELSVKDQADAERPSKEMTTGVPASSTSPSKNLSSVVQVKSESKTAGATDPVAVKKPSASSQQAERAPNLPSSVQVKSEAKTAGATDPVSAKRPLDRPQQAERAAPLMNSADSTATLKSDSHKAVAPPKPTEKPLVQQVPAMSRPLSAPIIPGPRPSGPVVSMVQTTPLLARSVSAAGRLGPDPSSATHSYVPQSYRNAIIGTAAASSTGFVQPPCPSSGLNPSQSYPQPPNLISSPMFLPLSSEKMEPNMVKPGVSFGMVNHDVLQNGPQWMECPQWDSSRHYDPSSLRNEIHNHDFYKTVASRSHDRFSAEFPASSSGRQTHGALTDEFPHLDIINDLLEDEHGSAKAARASTSFQSFSNGPSHHLNRQFTFPGDIGMSNDVGPSTSSCRFERTRSYHDDGFQQRGYDSLGGQFDLVQDLNIPQVNPQAYVNGQIDGLIPPNPWQMAGSDLSLLGMRNVEGDGYPYRMPDYSNLACGVNGYTVFRPSNGH